MSDKVVVALPDRANEFQHLQADDARAVGARLGIGVELLDADGNAILQIQQIFKFIDAPRSGRGRSSSSPWPSRAWSASPRRPRRRASASRC